MKNVYNANAFEDLLKVVGSYSIAGAILLFSIFSDCFIQSVQAQQVLAPTDFYVYEGLGEGTENGFELRWTDHATDEDSYVLERSTDGVQFSVKQELPANAEKASDGIEVGSLYWYRVRARRGSQFSNPSNVMKFTSLWQPIYFTISTIDPRAVRISFFDRSTKEQGYVIERSADGGKTFAPIVKQPTSSYQIVPGDHGSSDKTKLFIDDNAGAGLQAGVLYQYRVAAYDAVGYSAYARPGYIAIGPGMVPNLPGLETQLTDESANGQTPTTVRITLSDNSLNEKRTEVERSVDRVNWISIGGISSTAGEPVVFDRRGDLKANTTYYYRAYATNDIGKSGYAMSTAVIVPAVPPTGNTNWYVWRGASGQPSGESWQNAWRDITQINWVAVKPGHTIYISGDNYQNDLSVFASGVQGNPIKIRPGSAAPISTGHNTKVIVRSVYFGSKTNWVTLDGGINGNFNPLSAIESATNINFETRDSLKHGIFAGNPVGISIRYVRVENAAASGIVLIGLPSDYLEVYGCHIKTTGSVGISFAYPSTRAVFDAFKLQKTLIEYTGDDAIQSSGNITISDNIIRYNNADSAGHADGIQSVGGNYFKIYNNAIYDRSKSSYFFTSGSARSGVSGHWHVFNNLFYYSNTALIPATAGILFSGQNDFEPGGAFLPEVTFSDILIANNTFVNFAGNRVFNFTKRDAQVGKVVVSDLTFVNNVIVDTAGIALKGDLASGIVYDEARLIVDNNLIAGSGDIQFKNAFYTPDQFNRLRGVSGNSNILPQFVDRNVQNFRLLSSDTVARNKGSDLSFYFNYDFEYGQRPVAGRWDIGAFEQGSARSLLPVSPLRLRAIP